MDKPRNNVPCSPYLRRPLRTLDQALKDQADVIRRDNEAILKQLGLPLSRREGQRKKAS